MCLAVPMRVRRIEDGSGIVEYNGVERRVSTLLIDGIKEGDYILVHAGFAISIVEKQWAEEIIHLMETYISG
ncbi:MAG: HypC/HybG/HupF family hydrogenase formation chaperone [Deltaproteobacteria bacterium]|nr:HypC/HybG/HupF family hydrogenase formation chaperone [Deltaproteobacteria bacterium]